MFPSNVENAPSNNGLKALVVLFAAFFAFIFLGGLGGWLGNIIGDTFYGVNVFDITQKTGGTSLAFEERQAIRWSNLIAHILGFTGAALLVTFFLLSSKVSESLGLNQGIKRSTILWSMLALFLSFPFIQLAIQLNLLLPLPEYIANMGNSQDWLVAEVLHIESFNEFFFVLIVAAIVPAIGEELLFRGLIQKQLEKILGSPHAGIWIAAIIFSAIHLQFAGFFPRLFLGAFLGYLYYWSGSIWLPILIHFLFNGLQVFATYLYPEMINNTAIDAPMEWSGALIGIGAALLLMPLFGKIKDSSKP